MHAVPGKSTWIKGIKAGNYLDWPILMDHNVQKYYPEATKTAKRPLGMVQAWVAKTLVNVTFY